MTNALDLVKNLPLTPGLSKKTERVKSRRERRRAERDHLKSTKASKK